MKSALRLFFVDEATTGAMSEFTRILQSAGHGEKHAASRLLPLVYDELRRMAAARMAMERAGQTLQATALVHEAWLRLAPRDGNPDPAWENRAHFFGAASAAMRRILIDNARRKLRLKRGGRPLRLDLDEVEVPDAEPDEKLISINEALHELERQNPERAQVVVMKFFGGLTNHQVGESLGLSERTVNRHWLCAKAWLQLRLRAEN